MFGEDTVISTEFRFNYVCVVKITLSTSSLPINSLRMVFNPKSAKYQYSGVWMQVEVDMYFEQCRRAQKLDWNSITCQGCPRGNL